MKENPGKKPLKKSDDDFDFEILNALEGHASSDDLHIGDENTIELSLDDDEDLQFDNDAFEQPGGFSFDDGLSAGLEEELMQSGADLGEEDSFEEEAGEDIEMPSGDDESFSLDLGNPDEAFSFDSEEMSLDLEKTSFESLSEEEEGFEAQNEERSSEFENISDSSGAETKMFTMPQEENSDISFDNDFAMNEELDISEEEDGSASEIDISGMDIEEEELESDEQEIRIDEEFADLEEDIEQGEDEFFEGDEDDELQAKAVIAVGEDTIIDLGHEDDFENAPVLPRIPTPTPPAPIEKIEPAIEPLMDVRDEEAGEEQEEFDTMQIDLNEEDAANAPEPEESIETEAEIEPAPAMPEEPENTLPAEEMPQESESPDESQEPPMPEEIDVMEFLGLTLRLRDEQMQEFEAMISEAKTLQDYLEHLESHQTDIKETIYHKLFVEYNARKRVIFKDDAFTGLLGNVEQDLQDMLEQRQDFTATVARLNEELEEIHVRHLVGEYTDRILAEKKEDQTAEIALWNEKTEKIQAIIERYQQAVDAERLLNPLRSETPPEPETAPQPEPVPMPIEPAPLPEEPEMPETEMPTEEPSLSEFPESEDGVNLADVSLEEDSVPETSFSSESDEALDEELLGGLSDLTQQAFEQDMDEDGGDLFGGEDESEEFSEELSEDEDFEGGDFLVDDLTGLGDLDEMEGEDEHVSFDYEVETESEEEEEEPAAAAMIACKKCGRQTPEDQKFCVHCGGKAK